MAATMVARTSAMYEAVPSRRRHDREMVVDEVLSRGVPTALGDQVNQRPLSSSATSFRYAQKARMRALLFVSSWVTR